MTDTLVHSSIEEGPSRTERQRGAPSSAPHHPVRTWAFIGVCCLAIQTYVLGSWILSDRFTRTPVGDVDVPTWMLIGARVFEVGATAALAVLLWAKVFKPRRQLGAIPRDGLFLLALVLIFWIDPFLNYIQNNGTYNAVFFNFGSWVADFPGSTAPLANQLAEPVFFVIPAYAVFVYGIMLFGGWVMRTTEQRHPGISRFRLIGVCFVAMMAADAAIEIPWLRLGYYSFPGAIRSVTLFAGHHYQYPLYEAVFAGASFTAYACLRYFTDAEGETMLERGISTIDQSPRRSSLMRFFAISGGCTVSFFLSYGVPMAAIGANSDPWPEDITSRPYLTNHMCGEGTPYACPGPDVPIPRDDSRHVQPDGTLSDPTDEAESTSVERCDDAAGDESCEQAAGNP